ncbi:MAG: hypothetical protein F2882_04170 [Actinobacteria bacterium]|jgi:plastocyanin|nr:cupredoxin domain-containing protein [Actinomycetota bacterium]MSV67396.1 hypothetical protein [Actinomycetota bacterium]
MRAKYISACMMLAVFGVGCSSDTTEPAAPLSGRTVEIAITDFEFVVPNEVLSSDRIVLLNNDSVDHNLMPLDESFSVDVGAGKTAELPQLAPGKYAFHCHIHPDMMGEIVVS